MDKNYYLVNKETNVIHSYFRSYSEATKPNPQGQTTLAGNFYLPEALGLTLDALQKMQYSTSDYDNFDWDAYYTEKGFGSIQDPFLFIARAHIVSYKGYRIFGFPENLVQLWDDFANNQLFELIAFISTLFKEELGEKEYAKWGKIYDMEDKYGVNEIIMSKFTIESDNSDLIYDAPELTDTPGPDKPAEGKKISISQQRYP
jgi:hypothetical protein